MGSFTIEFTNIFLYALYGDFIMYIFKKTCESYRQFGANTRLIIRITILLFSALVLTSIYALNATHSESYFELLILSDELLQCAKNVSGIGFWGMLIVGATEVT